MSDAQQPVREVEVIFQPIGRRITTQPGENLLSIAQDAGIELASICGGMGTCGSCRVKIVEGQASYPTSTETAEISPEDIASGFRYACQTTVNGDLRIDIPPESLTATQRLQVEGQELVVELDPNVSLIDVQLSPPGLTDLRSDHTRLSDYLVSIGKKDLTLNYQALLQMSTVLRNHSWQGRLAVKGKEIIAVLPPGKNIYGLAVDVGTTKVAAYLVDLVSGETVSKAGAMNPQIAYGEDVISRISFATDKENGAQILQQKLVATLNSLIETFCGEAGISNGQIVDSVIVGNTAMHHLLAGLEVRQLGEAPYVPSVSDSMEIPAISIGLNIAPGGVIFLPPNIAGYVGADHVAMLLAAEAAQDRQEAHTIVSLDIGTNTEISLYHWGKHLCCSCASGPAFEGAHIRDGMRAAPGAIERVRILTDQIQIYTIGNQAAVGICGSGILDAVSELVARGVIDGRGVFTGTHQKLLKRDGKYEFILADQSESGNGRDIVVTRKDVNEIQLAKGAIRAGLEVMLSEVGITDEDIEEFIVAGAFGTYLDLESAIHIGMFPNLPRERFKQVGNAAGLGAKSMLLSRKMRKQAEEINSDVEYVELTTHPGFTDAYMEALAFKN
jgi:uncharacterized 2Fe-2S/4Fe-4S cluster protein (DUF4445 family)